MMPSTARSLRPAQRGPDLAGIAAEVREGLSAPDGKTLPTRYLYDAVGSALFEAICLLPEYGLARADARVLERAAPELTEHLGPVSLVVELGSGSGSKTRGVLQALARESTLTYRPIDVSAAALQRCRRVLANLPGVFVAGVEADFLAGLQRAAGARRADERLLLLFLGSTLGNFERPAATDFLRAVRDRLRPGDGLLLGTDLIKPAPQLLAAYDDPAGVTAAFDLNLLARINRELSGDFDLRAFAHEARWNEAERRVEMHLRSLRPQLVHVRGCSLRVAFREGETIWTESSCKYDADEPSLLGARAGFQCVAQWVDDAWPFAESLLLAV